MPITADAAGKALNMSALKPENFGAVRLRSFLLPALCERYMLILKPVTFKQANEFVKQYHRHNTVSQGCKFCVGVTDEAGGGVAWRCDMRETDCKTLGRWIYV